MKKSMIVATSLNYAIGKENKLLWNLPADMAFFKKITMGKPVVMGRKTFQSIGRELPGRRNVVITRDEDFKKRRNIDTFFSLESAFESLRNEKEIFIIGGGEIYRQSIGIVDFIYLTLVDTVVEGDSYFPEIDDRIFELEWEEKHMADDRNLYGYTFKKYRVKKI